MKVMKNYTKYLVMLLAFALVVNSAAAQFLGGFFNQKGTQRKYMVEQIALYGTYLGYLKKGYTIARDGLNTVGDIRRGELRLHTDYHNALATVSPAIKNQQQVKDALRYQDDIRQMMGAACRIASSSSWLQDAEKKYLARVCIRIDRELARLNDEVIAVISSGHYKMTDDERLHRIATCLRETQSLYGYTTSYAADIRTLISGRIDRTKEIESSKVLFHLQ
jgi:tellurite resistance protein